MPDLSSIPIPRYNASDPYYYTYDNKPLDALNQIINLINSQVDINTQTILNAGGSFTLPQRLNISLYDNGSLKTAAVDNALHNIGYHADGSYTVDSTQLTTWNTNLNLSTTLSNPVPFVRMLKAERDKLATIDEDATNLTVSVFNDTTQANVAINSGVLQLDPSSTIIWKVTGGTVTAEVTTSLSNSHQHYDNTVPVSASLTPDYRTYLVNGPAFMAGSLKVYINGMRIFPAPNSVYVPSSDPSLPWSLNSFAENGTTGFILTNAITQDDIIMVDFTVALT